VPTMSAADIKRLRQDTGENAATFGKRFHRSGRTVEDWEQGRRQPDSLVSAMMLRLRRTLDRSQGEK
jgi:DNA-binding transcriptional regulator YiaG